MEDESDSDTCEVRIVSTSNHSDTAEVTVLSQSDSGMEVQVL